MSESESYSFLEDQLDVRPCTIKLVVNWEDGGRIELDLSKRPSSLAQTMLEMMTTSKPISEIRDE